MSLLGLDVGTIGCKAAIYSEKGKLLSKSYRENELITADKCFELNPIELWKSCVWVIREAVRKNKESDEIQAMSVCTIGEAACPISRNGKILHNIILHVDQRGSEFIKDVEERIGRERIFSVTGQTPNHIYTIFKILWYKKHMRELYCKVHKFLLLEDYILHKMGFDFFISYSLASRTSAFDVNKQEWSREILEYLNIDRELFSKPVPTGYSLGILDSKIARTLGLKTGVKVFSGCHDFMSATLGAGVIDPNVGLDNIATFEGLGAVQNKFIVNKELLEGNISINCSVDGKYLYIGYVASSGSALKWFRDRFCSVEKEIATKKNIDPYDLILEKIPERPTNLLFLPHLVGSGTPYLDPTSKGALIGLTIDTSKHDIAKSILEGASYEFRINLDLLKLAGFSIRSLNASGGGAKSEKWLQIKANIYNTEINQMEAEETGCLGLAMICARSLGIYRTYADCVKNMTKRIKTFLPNRKFAKKYRIQYDLFKRLYPSLRSLQKLL